MFDGIDSMFRALLFLSVIGVVFGFWKIIERRA